MSKCQRKSLQPDIFDRNMMRCLNILLAQRSDMRDESKAFFFISDKRGEDKAVGSGG